MVKSIAFKFLGVVLFYSLVTSCFSTKIYETSDNLLTVTEAYIRAEVPGTEEENPTYYAHIILAPYTNDGIRIDSIEFQSQTFEKLKIKPVHSFKFKIDKLENPLFTDDFKDFAIIYFSRSNQSYSQLVNTFKIKEPLYLP